MQLRTGNMNGESITVLIPAKNEENSIGGLVREIRELYPDAEVLVVNDGSTDATAGRAREAGALVIDHPYSKGNGAAIKAGARRASRPVLVCMDGDGQHRPGDIGRLVKRLEDGFEMVVGARHAESQAGRRRAVANTLFNWLASWMVGHRIQDLTSGFRAVRTGSFRRFLFLLPNGFSYPTTITMAFFRSGLSVGYERIAFEQRQGKSHIRLMRDGVRFALIIFRIGTLYSPLKVFVPAAAVQGLLGVGYYMYTLIESGRFTNMSALMLTSALIVFLIGLVSEQITALIFKDDYRQRETDQFTDE